MIYILANGGQNIGMGHIMRTLVLAKELSKNYIVKYFSSYDNEFKGGIEKIKEEGFTVLEAKDILKYLTKKSILIIDKYSIKEEELIFLRGKVKLLCYIDDNGELDYYDVDLVINQNIYGTEINYDLINSKAIVGGRYTLLRDEFLNCNKIKVNNEIKNILVTVGGSDNLNLTHKILSQIKYFNSQIDVVIGNAFIYKNELIEEFKDFSNIKFHVNPVISKLMEKSDLAIASCGSTLYELAYLGVPTIGLIIVDNQRRLGEFMNKYEVIKLADFCNIKNTLVSITYENRVKLNKNMKYLVDGRGKKRIKNEIELLLKTM